MDFAVICQTPVCREVVTSIKPKFKENSFMNGTVLIVIGAILLIFAAIYPFPPIFAIPGIIWRIVIGLLGLFSLIMGIKLVRRR